MAELQKQTVATTTGTLEKPVVTSKSEQPMIVSQHSLLQAVNYLRSELEKVQSENNNLTKERISLIEQLELEKNKFSNSPRNSSRNSIETTETAVDIVQEEEEGGGGGGGEEVEEEEGNSDTSENKNEQEIIISELQLKIEQVEKEKEEFIAYIEQEKQVLKAQLDLTQEEKQQLEIQHQSLIAKLANFKTSIADKLKTDLEDLNQKKQQIESLNLQNQELITRVSELQSDLSISRTEHDNTTQQLHTLEAQLYEIQRQTSQEISEKDKTIRDLQINLDRSERERVNGEVTMMELKSAKDEFLSRIKHLEREMEVLKQEKETLKAEKDNETESLNNLQNVLEEFEAAKQSEIREAVEGIQRRLATTAKELSEFKERALLAEEQLTQSKEEAGRTSLYEKEIKEKNLLIGKLRHEAVILNEHLTEALRRMREESSENNVDKRLITNLLIAFFNTPRGDSKRYEILQLMANMLQWTDEQKELVGLIRKAFRPIDDRSSNNNNINNGVGSGNTRWVSGLWTPTIERPRSRLSEDAPRSTIRLSEDDEPNESFSDMWISFLLKEASKENLIEQKIDINTISTQSGEK
ncbi:hypothetical protein Glove_579g13 [Diversispora epigaea]|uniref:GRIP domain-containing protein n=1 Tax=Diversispora epigaea TaxID=1348612 RepID=A0A397GBJ5_9GLOM|nr:hypothetical protein Glove_579g13 [Diversispora epigaea]